MSLIRRITIINSADERRVRVPVKGLLIVIRLMSMLLLTTGKQH